MESRIAPERYHFERHAPQPTMRTHRPSRGQGGRWRFLPRSSKGLALVALVALIVIVGVGAGISANVSAAAKASAEAAAREADAQAWIEESTWCASVIGEVPVSTPRALWCQGKVPYLYQTDPEWADAPYAGGTIRKNACGPTSLTMVYVALTGDTSKDPRDLCALAEAGGYAVDGMTAWTFMTEGARSLGLASRDLPADPGAVYQALEAGHLVICSVVPGDFTKTGHFIVLTGVTESGELEIRDPNSAENSRKTWDVQRVLNQCAGLWELSA